LDHEQTEIDNDQTKNGARIENALKAFWEKAHTASDLLSAYRAEIHSYRERQSLIEKELQSLRSDVQSKDQEIKRLRAEHAQLAGSQNTGFTSEEREHLKNRIKDLLSKLNSHL
jgi:peptidoglycan hydrolase CwlO-like protein